MNWKKILGFLIVIAAVVFIGFSVFGPKEKAKVSTVSTTEVKEKTVVETLSTTGKLEPIETQDAYGQGVVSEVNVAVGDTVEKDATLVSYLDGTKLKANFAGTVTALNVKKDEADLSAQTAKPSVSLADLSNLKVAISLSKSDASIVKKDQAVTLRTGNETFKGRVSAIDPVATTTTGATGSNTALGGTIVFDTPPAGLFAGFEIDADITTNTADNALTIPVEALLYDKENKPFVYTIKKDQAKKVMIETGIQSDNLVQINKGLTKGEKVILTPDDSIKNGTRVTAK
ncbi:MULTISPECIES: efflux RND transporter periplasmic adaptor subunit [Carnobacterium]|uniref:efflux RND transporter periplasmic adaptor subunit n=1 Tax=Carnobacterium TaxID=2747 RepID=UPI000D4C0E0D|nr:MULTISPECIES: HlyD family efflux transporter periplasmic adaptor subunit [Carnobacterium]MCO6017033.1 HlyD family efflux transporter periplasmic adaptor subunit [Carnobacterium divergens]MDT1940366.1 HlyD family efflux transporter periplasmic adaptor subunit [Carnobacterium divergens]MDT1942804.1 HlyD family efflux transporter periplasmic adaptor subunit [Carnobacterium divergens]MDT1948610.1 HlyD family efflux transporter periplasmic adaptor subunit [Carnobacterium divergens]MDT1951091.1 H